MKNSPHSEPAIRKSMKGKSPINILLADDDADDCFFFKDVLSEIPLDTKLVIVNDGVELMQLLPTLDSLPDVLFLDLNMPLKSGYDCLREIKQDEKLKHLTVIIYSTSNAKDVANSLEQQGADFYIRKPAEFASLKNIIHHALLQISGGHGTSAAQDTFILSVE